MNDIWSKHIFSSEGRGLFGLDTPEGAQDKFVAFRLLFILFVIHICLQNIFIYIHCQTIIRRP